jgi:hypothetical protein
LRLFGIFERNLRYFGNESPLFINVIDRSRVIFEGNPGPTLLDKRNKKTKRLSEARANIEKSTHAAFLWKSTFSEEKRDTLNINAAIL